MIIDNFAGGGGASTGIEQALGRAVDIAINHDEQAIRMHEVNHPGTRHIRNNIWQVDPRDVTGGEPVELAWFSPDCKHFSKAKGGKPRDKSIRDLAWVVVLWAKRVKPQLILLENVEEFRTWGPLCDEGKPIKERAGETFDKWCRELRKAGYKLQFRELRACDYGAPTIRKRFFMIARCDGQPIVWPEPTHGKPGSPEVLSGKRKPWRTAAEIIDWSIPCPSIFTRKKPLAEKTLRRIAHGIMKFVVNNPSPFIVPMSFGNGAVSIDDPLQTVTTQGNRHNLVMPYFARTAHGDVDKTGKRRGQPCHGPEEPFPTVTQSGDSALIVPHVTKFRNGAIGHAADEPLATVTANSFVKRPGGSAPLGRVDAVLAPFASYAQQGGANRSAEDPLHTVTASVKDHNCVAAAHLVHMGNGERQGQAPRAMDVEKPLGTVVAGGKKHAAVTAFLERQFGRSEGASATEPLPTTTAGGGGKSAVVVAHIEQANGSPKGEKPLPGRAADAPLSTIVGKGCTQRLVTSNLVKLRGTCAHGQPVDEPLHTVSAGGNHMAEVRAFLLKYYGTDQDPRLEEPLHSVTTKDRFGLVTVTIEGEEYVIVDIGMRMLSPRELFNAQGFPFWDRSFRIDLWRGPTIQAVEDLEHAPESSTHARSAEAASTASQPSDQSAPAAVHARIDLGLQVLQLRNLARSSSAALSAEPCVTVPLPIEIASAAQTLAPGNSGYASEPIHFERPSANGSTQAPNGAKPASRSGAETTRPASGVERVTVTEIGASRSITSPDGPRSRPSASSLRTLSCFVADVIASSTLAGTSTGSSSVELEVRHHYIIDRDSAGKPITKTAQVAKCGNSVCPPLARAITAANARSLAPAKERAAA